MSQEMPNLLRSLDRFWLSDNNFGNYYIDKYHMNLSDKAVIDLLIFFNAESSWD